ncbi:unnamed protein product [Effrenium voratum]|nr:unnamed protein product [Effrenium voratum]CAJ1441864.1 unnamed protein product [Effrenium voratum]|mmetsp:Transcript_81134/g.194659  ORF Transcript_81134/g.194659 Transcript_81134/m.194659 type:complete len:820 (+) Transcript_81134:66-2525(+)|eukprot:CAMPEP_0181409370 /NCGR_PEP_ID=MMETSP1110-20121109/6784_1 /TAXON_ID=174948 /ORGANISM="Symbiodinium sp., Strain CCMP421" /LENGTH=819 /DNA_ID=CAMNT_0023531875 /DNA_START=61 /DNA_END=2520 /DNA_ORIENTATION=-
MSECEPRICEVGGAGLLLPIFTPDEQEWHPVLRACLYFTGLIWSFMGVGIVSDIFMGSIEKVTSKKKRVFSTNLQTFITVKVWNATVSNLTLMALGSSAPEILLSVIELLKNGMYSGDLGPSTIVGSAAFNLLCITAVCVSAIPDGEVRRIKDMQVFAVTASFSVFAYLWLLIIVMLWTPNIITIEEAVIAFILFPVLVVIAFMADKGYFSRTKKKPDADKVLLDAATEQEIATMRMRILKKHGTGIPDDKVMKLIKEEFGAVEEPSRAARRMAATEKLFGGGRRKSDSKIVPIQNLTDEGPAQTNVTFTFEHMEYSCLESCDRLELMICRDSDTTAPLGKGSVMYRTVEVTAKDKKDFIASEGVIEFDEDDTEKLLMIKILDDDEHEPDTYFNIELHSPVTGDFNAVATLGKNPTAHVRIVDDDAVGVLAFRHSEIKVKDDFTDDKVVNITVLRQAGAKGKISCEYHTEDGTAIHGIDYDETSGTLELDDQETEAEISVVIKPKGRTDSFSIFRLYIEEASGGATFAAHTDGGEECCICTIVIGTDTVEKRRTEKFLQAFKVNWEVQVMARENWKDQFIDAIFLQTEEAEGCELVTAWVFHIITMPWKVIFALLPPVDYCGGWLCFLTSLMMIGAVTALIGDLAELCGCVVNMPDAITAISLVALGTSLPDTFASKTAAEQDPTADASIGNVTGSNSVNVFLGLGFPWTIGAVYWAALGALPTTHPWFEKYAGNSVITDYPSGGVFVVLGGNLGFSVAVFCCCALSCILVLLLRRWFAGGELGGHRGLARATSCFLVGLWLLYVGLSSWNVLSEDSPC